MRRKTNCASPRSSKPSANSRAAWRDFNNLLTGVGGSLEMLQTRLARRQFIDLDRFINAAQAASTQAAALTHRLLAFSRRQNLDPKPTNANRLRRRHGGSRPAQLWPAISVETALAEDLSTTFCDPGQLENAILNLGINARDAMPDGGRLTIATANAALDGRAAHAQDMARGQYIMLCVTDTGTGMAPEVIERAFDPFYTTKPMGQGTGLGLSMTYGFAKQSGGQVHIDSEIGKGTTMRIYLPRRSGEEDVASPPAPLAQGARAEHGETVFVIDDVLPVRMLVMDVLGRSATPRWRRRTAMPASKFCSPMCGSTCWSPTSDCRRHERAPNRRRCSYQPAGPEGSIHHGLRRERRHAQRIPRAGHADHDQAVHHGGVGDAHQKP